VTERDWQKTVTDALSALGWTWTHFRPAKTAKGWRTPLSGHKGFPDVVAVRGERVLFLELKAERGRLSSEQAHWCAALGLAGQSVHVVRPSDFDWLVEVIR
jgi:VRR-NUC domain